VFRIALNTLQASLSLLQASESSRIFARFSAGFGHDAPGRRRRSRHDVTVCIRRRCCFYRACAFEVTATTARVLDHVFALRRSSHCEGGDTGRYFTWELSGIQDRADRRMA
jgi:hypothetical protein